jgi:hypothetical protein
MSRVVVDVVAVAVAVAVAFEVAVVFEVGVEVAFEFPFLTKLQTICFRLFF